MNDDAALVAAALSGGPEAFAPIVERYRDAAFGVALARLRNFHDAEDVTQAAFVEAYERLGNLKDPARLGAWLRSITIHRSIDHLRQRIEIAGVGEIDKHLSDHATPHTEMERQELRDRIVAAIGRLSRPQAETTVLFYINGYSQEEIARIQEVPVGTVKRRLHDARNRLREEMMDVAEDVLKKNAPKEDLSKRVFELLCRYPEGKRLNWREVVSELRKIGTPGVEGFIRAFALPHWRTRRWAVTMLKESRPQPVEMVIDLLKKGIGDSNKKVRKAAAAALLKADVSDNRKRKDFVPEVVSLLRDPTWRVRWRAACELLPWAADVPLDVAALALAGEKDARVRVEMAQLVRAVIAAQGQKKGGV